MCSLPRRVRARSPLPLSGVVDGIRNDVECRQVRPPELNKLARVQQIMGDYMGGTCQPDNPFGLPTGESAAETEELALSGRAVYRHTNEGWGDSDWGEITFEKGRVVRIQFLPD